MNDSSTPNKARKMRAEHVHSEMDHLNAIVHNLLLIGLGLSTFMMVLGIILQIVSGNAMPTSMVPPQKIFPDLLAVQPAAYFTLGLLLLIATPILRVIGSIIIYIYDRDWRYILVTVAVLLIIGLSVFFG